MKLCILALDGLDYYLVKEFDMQELLQGEYGIISHAGLPPRVNTSQIWASFITGLPPQEHGIADPSIDQRNARIKRGIRTIFDIAKRSIAKWIPGYNPHPDYWHPAYIDLLFKCVKDKRYEGSYWALLLELFWRQTDEFMEKVKKEWDLLMAHFNYLDALGHAFFRKKDKMRRAYEITCDFVRSVQSYLRPKGVVLWIVSDHGMVIAPDGTGDHSNYGFYSSNVKLGLGRPTFFDFFKLVEELLKE